MGCSAQQLALAAALQAPTAHSCVHATLRHCRPASSTGKYCVQRRCAAACSGRTDAEQRWPPTLAVGGGWLTGQNSDCISSAASDFRLCSLHRTTQLLMHWLSPQNMNQLPQQLGSHLRGAGQARPAKGASCHNSHHTQEKSTSSDPTQARGLHKMPTRGMRYSFALNHTAQISHLQIHSPLSSDVAWKPSRPATECPTRPVRLDGSLFCQPHLRLVRADSPASGPPAAAADCGRLSATPLPLPLLADPIRGAARGRGGHSDPQPASEAA